LTRTVPDENAPVRPSKARGSAIRLSMLRAAHAARLMAQALRVAPAQSARGCASSAAAAASREVDSRVVAYALGAFGALPFLAATPAGFELVREAAKSTGHTLPVRPARPAAHSAPASRCACARDRSRWTAQRSFRRGTAAAS
jgi:hypothetical protein